MDSIDHEQAIRDIEKLFAEATPANVRHISRQLERLVRTLDDPKTRQHYEAAIDQLPEMVKHLSED
ncbi:MAG: hypothetical protein ACK46X_12255 [Candidatus Sericytochromatia bacterium]